MDRKRDMNIVSLSAGAQITAVVPLSFEILPDVLASIAFGVMVLSMFVYWIAILFWLKTVDEKSKHMFGGARFLTAIIAWIPVFGPIITYPLVYLRFRPYAP